MPKRPHIVLITSDQQRGDALGCEGHPVLRTPHLDLLAYEGTRFTRAYSDCPVCIPARTTLVTGIQSHHYGRPGFSPEFRINRARDQFLAARLTAAGYQTHLVGKAHWHTDATFRGGFESWDQWERLHREQVRRMGRDTNLTGLGRNELTPGLSHFPAELYSTDWAIDRGIDFLQTRDQTAPLFLWISLVDPHPPVQIHEPYYSMYDHEPIPRPNLPDWARQALPCEMEEHRQGNNAVGMKPGELRKARGVYYGMVTNIDHQLARLFGQLMSLGMWKDTAVFYTSDHGELLGDFGDFCKSSFLDASARVPMIARLPRWMSTATGQASSALVELADLYPTLLELGGAEIPGDIDGRTLMPILTGHAAGHRDHLHGQIEGSHMFHDGRYKYLYSVADGRELLFDMDADPSETHDLSGDAALLKPIREKFIQHLAAERHAHLVGGKLLNEHRTLSPRNQRSPIDWLGWAGTGSGI